MQSGIRLGPYEIVKQLGVGGMGEVWLAEDTRLGRQVAIKVLPAEFAADPERLARFEQERTATSVTCRNGVHRAFGRVCSLFDEDLFDRCDERGPWQQFSNLFATEETLTTCHGAA